MTDRLSEKLAADVLRDAGTRGLTVTAAESCTGGLVAAALTSVPGSSAAFGYGFVTYANEAKASVLGVGKAALATHGAVSRQVAEEMAHGALAVSGADCAVSITGIAGPGGGSPAKPVGLVWFAAISKNGFLQVERRQWPTPSRSTIRTLSARQALGMLLRAVRAV